MSRQIRVPIIFHPPTYEEYSAEEVASEVMCNAFGACKIDHPEITDSIHETLEWLEFFERDVANFRRKCKMAWEADVRPDRPLSTGTLILTIL